METQNSFIEKKELRLLLASKFNFRIIDVRSKVEFDEKHIPTAVNIPLDILKEVAQLFDPIITYVTVCGKGGGRSIDAANILKDLEFDAFWLIGGTFGWLEG